MILDRVMEYADVEGIQRFSMIAWQGREYLSCNQLPYNIFFVKRGYISSYSYHKCIMPFDGQILKKWREVILKPSEVEGKIIQLLERMDIRNCLINIINSEDIEEYQDVCDFLRQTGQISELWNWVPLISEVILEQIAQMKFKPEYTIQMLLSEYYDDIMKCDEIYLRVIRWTKENLDGEIEQEKQEKINLFQDNLQNDRGFLMLCSAWIYFCRRSEDVFQLLNHVKDIYQEDIKNNDKKKIVYDKKRDKQVDFLVEHMSYKFEREEVKHYVDLYEAEILELYSEMEGRRVREYLNRFQANNRLFSKLRGQSLTGAEENIIDHTKEKGINVICLK